ncbi:hypothetical protein A2U01_0106017, partial [Trifolium medium]|nr:hypothetical protein [Trifolium medium]
MVEPFMANLKHGGAVFSTVFVVQGQKEVDGNETIEG